jgi:hypothetical protein
VHLKCSPPLHRDQAVFEAAEHLDACFGVHDVESLASDFTSAGASFSVALRQMPYGKDGYILGFV